MCVNDPIVRTREVCTLGRLTVSADMLAWRFCAVAAVAAFAGLPIGKREAEGGGARGGRRAWEKQQWRAAGEEMRCTPEKRVLAGLCYTLPMIDIGALAVGLA